MRNCCIRLVIRGVRPNSPAITIIVVSTGAARFEIVEQGAHATVHRRQQVVLQMRKGVAVRVPGLILRPRLTWIMPDAEFDEPPRPSGTKAEQIAAHRRRALPLLSFARSNAGTHPTRVKQAHALARCWSPNAQGRLSLGLLIELVLLNSARDRAKPRRLSMARRVEPSGKRRTGG